MVVINDFHKLILYQRLNLGYECTFCKKTFYNRHEQGQHMKNFHLHSTKKENLQCSKCGKAFGNIKIYQLHLQIHALSDPGKKTEEKQTKETNKDCSTQDILKKPDAKKKIADKVKQKPQVKKPVGLTKVKMEDCLRCDACSCIYLDQNDYYKHMKNFHKIETNIPESSITNNSTTGTKVTAKSSPNIKRSPIKSPSSKKMCRSCCNNCKGQHCKTDSILRKVSQRNKEFKDLFQFSMQDNIKDRWSRMISQNLKDQEVKIKEEIKIKSDPDADSVPSSENMDISHLLSQVEVKIKTEPPDYN